MGMRRRSRKDVIFDCSCSMDRKWSVVVMMGLRNKQEITVIIFPYFLFFSFLFFFAFAS